MRHRLFTDLSPDSTRIPLQESARKPCARTDAYTRKAVCAALVALGLFLSVAAPATAQTTTDAPGPVPADSLQHAWQNDTNHKPAPGQAEPDGGILTLAVENDKFGGNSDRHYTSGVRLSYFNVNSDIPRPFHVLDSLVPTFELNETSTLVYSLGHNLYSPENIGEAAEQADDRPWAAFLYGSVGLTTFADNHIDELELTLGVVGPPALGEQVQKFIHNHISDSPSPKGWRHQIKTEPGLMLSGQRRWPETFRADVGPLLFTTTPYVGATLGNIYTYANAGINFRFGDQSARWDDLPLRVKPSIPGTGYFEKPHNTMSWYLFGGVEGRAVARNIFLDGNTFRDSASVDKKPLVGDVSGGAAVTVGPTKFTYTMTYRTKEFDGQDKGDIFGALSVGYRF